jgi:hypothetical protein
MSDLKRGDIFSLNHNGLSYVGFVQKAGKYLNLVLFDNVSQSLKTLSHVSPSVLNYSLLSKRDMPDSLAKAYSDCFLNIEKGTTVEFDFDGNTYTGLVIKGGANIKVEVILDGKTFHSKGLAHSYRLKN